MIRPHGRAGRWLLAGLLVVVSATAVRPARSAALGPVIAVTPYEVVANGFVGWVFDPQVSGRGESVTVVDREVRDTGFVFMDNAPTREPMVDGEGAAVSADGCIALWARRNGSTALQDGISIGITDRCRGGEREVIRTGVNYDGNALMALSADGRFAAVQLPPAIGTEFDPNYVVRIDTATGAVLPMPPVPGSIGSDASMGLDISDDGNTIVATHTVPLSPIAAAVVYVPSAIVWEVPTGAVRPVSAAPSMFATLSGSGRHVAISSTARLTGAESGTGPWVYVVDRTTGTAVRVSAANGTAYYSSISGDATQVAFAVGPARCLPGILNESNLNEACPTGRIDVAYGGTPGLAGGFSVETISLDVNNRVAGFHAEPSISWTGRWVVWTSFAGQALVGSTDPSLQNRHAFLRERDGALAADGVNVGSARPGGVLDGTSTVRNTGRTSVVLDRIDATAPFTVVPGGTCAIGAVLAPGGACTVVVRFTAPAALGDQAGTLTVGENRFDPIVATAGLAGRSVADPPPATTTTTTTTTLPRQSTPTPTTTTTVPGVIELAIDPPLVDYGPVAVGIGSEIRTVTVANVGNRPTQLVTSMLGAHADDFFVATNGCNGITLQPGQTCTMDVLMVALAGGGRTATLSVEVPSVGGVEAVLQGQGRFSPRLLASPAAITERGLTTIIGQGFPSDQPVTVVVGDSGLAFTVQPDALGMFRIPLAAFPSLTLGSYVVRVDPRPETYELVQTLLVVQLPTFQPQGPGGPAFGDSILVTRGG